MQDPKTATAFAVLDRTKEPGSIAEPLYLDVVAALNESWSARPRVIGGRFGLSSKEFTPAMAKSVFDELKKFAPKNHFTIGIVDDITHTSLEYDHDFSTEDPQTVRAVFYGLGSDGTVGAKRTPSKSSASVRTIMHKAILFTIRKRPGRSRCPTCVLVCGKTSSKSG